VADLVRRLRRQGHDIRYVDAGGGLGISYEGAQGNFEEQIAAYARAVLTPLRGLNVHLLLEPGRAIVGAAGVLLARVLYRKTNRRKRFLIVDAGMNDLLRPSLYSAYHEIVSVRRKSHETEITDVVGPICETGDFFARDRNFPWLTKEICWPFSTWEPTDRYWDRTTTRAGGRRKCWWMGRGRK